MQPTNHYILVVDDNPDICAYYRFVLEHCGYQVRTMLSGCEAFAVATEFQPDLILTDLLMPDMDGLTFIECVRKKDELKKVPIIVISGLPYDQLDQALKLGASKILNKPIDPLTLDAEIVSVLPLTSFSATLAHNYSVCT